MHVSIRPQVSKHWPMVKTRPSADFVERVSSEHSPSWTYYLWLFHAAMAESSSLCGPESLRYLRSDLLQITFAQPYARRCLSSQSFHLPFVEAGDKSNALGICVM